ncbi:MAG: hypothetical protein U0234_00505 [Sandaracinus sp.]
MRARVLAFLFVALPCSVAAAQETAPGAEAAPPSDATTASPEATTTAGEAEAEAEASATPAPPTRAPKIAIVIAGDPDAQLTSAARALEETLAADAALTMPSDPAMRGALRGEGHDDGLDDVRSERRHLGLGEARDIHALTVLGELVGADLVLVVRSAHGAPIATSFDVLRRAFYDGELALEPIDVARALHFVERRATRAARPLAEGETTNPPPRAEGDEAQASPAVASPAEAAEAATEQEPAEHQPDFFEQYWPYFAAGALLIGAVVFVVFATQTNETPPPVLRFHLGPD